ncbi:MAG: hypothetical protein IJN66_06850 [Muribaculaceae bacterium]|nr:hypothetical protein [Muribaculaceae bacterium]
METTKKKLLFEYDMKSAPVALLWNYITTENGLNQWFADDVKIENKNYVFTWGKSSQTAHLLGSRTGMYIKMRWEDDLPGVYFEMRITVNELTDTTMLSISDFAEDGEEDEVEDLWTSQIESLKRLLGC